MLLVPFLTAMFFAARATFQEQLRELEEQSNVIATSVMATAEAGHIDRATIARALANLPVPDDGVVAMMDVKTGSIVSARGPAAVLASLQPDHVPHMVTRIDVDGFGRAYASAAAGDGLSRIVVGLPRRMAWAQASPIFLRNAINAGAWYLILFATLYFFLSRWNRSVRHLEETAARVSAGDLRTPAPRPMPTSELEQMQTTMTEMITRVRELQRHVVRQERLAAVGTLVSGVAHEISNPLQSILGSAQIIQAHAELPGDVQSELTIIQQESARAGNIIRNLTRFTRQQPGGPGPVRLSEIAQWLTDLWRRRLDRQGILLEVDDQATRVASGVATELQQVALNFLVNAEYAVLRGSNPARRVIVRTRDAAESRVRFEVEDSGAGVDPKDQDKLFHPFFTTKPVGEGTGLGLSISYGIVHSYGGTIGYDRGEMGGARFYFEIPAV